MSRSWFAPTLILLLVLEPAAHADDAATVGAVTGTVVVERLGSRFALKSGDTLLERDVITVSPGSGLRVALAADSVLDAGADSQFAIERLSAASGGNGDAKTIVSLGHGALRIDWHGVKSGAESSFHLFFAGQRATLSDGEYFIDSSDAASKVCVAAGEMALAPSQTVPARSFRPSACYRVAGGRLPQIEMRGAQYWARLREQLNPVLHAAARNEPAPPKIAPTLVERDARLVPTAPPDPTVFAAPSGVAPGPKAAIVASPAPIASAVPMAADVPASDAAAAVADTDQASSAPPLATPGWIVNLASYEREEDATGDVQRLQSAGYPAVAIAADVRGDRRYRVQLRGFSSQTEARTKADEVQARFGYKGFFLLRTP